MALYPWASDSLGNNHPAVFDSIGLRLLLLRIQLQEHAVLKNLILPYYGSGSIVAKHHTTANASPLRSRRRRTKSILSMLKWAVLFTSLRIAGTLR